MKIKTNKFQIGDHIKPLSDGIRHYGVTTDKWRGIVSSSGPGNYLKVTNDDIQFFDVSSQYFELDPDFHIIIKEITYTLF